MTAKNLAELAEASAARLGERSIFEIEGERYTNWQLLDRSQRLHAAFAELGLGHGDRAVVLMMNHALVFPVMQGIFRTGATAIPVMPQSAASELRYVLSDTEAKLVITDVERLPTCAKPWRDSHTSRMSWYKEEQTTRGPCRLSYGWIRSWTMPRPRSYRRSTPMTSR